MLNWLLNSNNRKRESRKWKMGFKNTGPEVGSYYGVTREDGNSIRYTRELYLCVYLAGVWRSVSGAFLNYQDM
jgi:hypothetical protein